MESNTAYNFINSISKLKDMLINDCVSPKDGESNIVYVDEEFTDNGLFRKYFVNEETQPRCMIVSNNKGIFFYEKKDQSKDNGH